jgi:hypothetical protein
MSIGNKMNIEEMYEAMTEIINEFIKSESKFHFPNEHKKILIMLKEAQTALCWASYYEERDSK